MVLGLPAEGDGDLAVSRGVAVVSLLLGFAVLLVQAGLVWHALAGMPEERVESRGRHGQ